MHAKCDSDITNWLVCFAQMLEQLLINAQKTTDRIINKASFWQMHQQHALNDRQVKILNTLLTNFYGKLTTKKWAAMTKCSIDTALLDMNDLIDNGISKIKLLVAFACR